jgi:hypothetical protein
MTQTNTTTTTAQALRTLAGQCWFSGRNQMNLARDTERDAEALAGPYGSAEAKAEAADSLPRHAARLIAAIEEQANRLPELRALSGVNGDAAEAIKLGGLVVAVKYHGPTARRGARLVATIKDALGDGIDSRLSRPFDHGARDNVGGAQVVAQAALDDWHADLRKSAPDCKAVATIRARGYHNGEHLFFCKA